VLTASKVPRPADVALADADAVGVEDTVADALDVDVAVTETVALGVALAVTEAVALGVALAVAVPDALAVTDGVAVEVSDVPAAATGASPRMTGAPASAALPPEPPHPARSITAHAMTAPAAFPLPERELNAPKRLLRALIEGRASPGLCPIIVHVRSGYWVPDPSTTV